MPTMFLAPISPLDTTTLTTNEANEGVSSWARGKLTPGSSFFVSFLAPCPWGLESKATFRQYVPYKQVHKY